PPAEAIERVRREAAHRADPDHAGPDHTDPDHAVPKRASAKRADTRPHRPASGPQPARTAGSTAAIEVRRRGEVTLRLVLEVLDRRRRPDQLKAFAVRSVVDSVSTIALTTPPGRELGTAILRRIHITSAGEHAAEICATYVRGRRTLAIAGRFERRK